MRILLALSLSLLIAAGAARAQGGERHLVEAADALDRQTCQEVINNCMRRIEVFTRMKYRRHVPVRVEPRAIWEARLKHLLGDHAVIRRAIESRLHEAAA